MKTSDFISWVGGSAAGGVPGSFEGVTFDSRTVVPGCLYVALKGENVDGHKFVKKALEAGAVAALVRADWEDADEALPLIRVSDPRKALTDAARAYRKTLSATVVGVTGSAGKTTTKELVAAFLSAGGKTYATRGNFNNDLGLPITILNTPEDVRFAVYEMGTNHPGEIAHLVSVSAPDVGLISSIGTAHIEFFKTQDGIADEKGTLFRVLPSSGFAVLAKENERYDRLVTMSAARVVTVSLDSPEAGRLRKALAGILPGEHNVSNALIAMRCATELGVSEGDCLTALAGFTLPGERWKVVERGGVKFINDAYNANPTSMTVSLKTFAAESVKGRRIAVLGDMFELGEHAEALHRWVGVKARDLSIDEFVLVGGQASEWIGGELEGKKVSRFADADGAKAAVMSMVRSGDAVLLKASHGMHLEKILCD